MVRWSSWCALVVSVCAWRWREAAAAAAQPECPAGLSAERCRMLGAAYDDYTYLVKGTHLTISFKDGGHFSMTCPENVTLDDEALPCFTEEVRVPSVYLTDCPTPALSSYSHVLQRLGVLALRTVTITKARGEVTAAHLAGLAAGSLVLARLRLADDALRAASVTTLRLDTVQLSWNVSALPASLHTLHLVHMGVTTLLRAELERLPALTALMVRDEGNISVEAPRRLTELALEGAFVWLDPALPDSLEVLKVYGWAGPAAPWSACGGLLQLVVDGSSVRALPDAWLVQCTSLRDLSVSNAPELKYLNDSGASNANALRGARSLESVSFVSCGLVRLPAGLLDHTGALSKLSLAGNALEELPSGLFGNTLRLRWLDLSHNRLRADALGVLKLDGLRDLRLRGNRALGAGLCADPRGISKLDQLKSLWYLDLSRTGLRHICGDLVDYMTEMRELNLSKNNITALTLAELQFRARNATVDLSGNNVTRLTYLWHETRLLAESREQYCRAPGATLRGLRAPLHCDCTTAPAAAALRLCPAHATFSPPLRCAGGGELSAAAPYALRCPQACPAASPRDELLCPAPCPAAAPRGCTCGTWWRVPPEGRAAPAAVLVLRVSCEHGAWGAGARDGSWGAGGARLQLQLRNNSLRELREESLPPPDALLELDVRDNVLPALPARLLRALPPDARLRLARNPLACTCARRSAMLALLARADLLAGDEPARCEGGGALHEPQCAGDAAPLAASLGALLALSALGAACLLRAGGRRRFKALLRRLGVPGLGEQTEEKEAGEAEAACQYDVFVSFCHADLEVAEALVARLEARWRVCVHWRDWVPGEWIEAQIAQSVRSSRRTLAVLSRAALGSLWARAEWAAALREARLLVVALEEPRELPLGAGLRAFLQHNTYLLWGDPWFWQKLSAALPAPRDPPDAPHAPRDPARSS